MARKVTVDIREKQSAKKDAMANMLNAGSFVKVGLLLSSLKPPGKVVEVVKASTAMRVATMDHDWEVLVSHSSPLLMSLL